MNGFFKATVRKLSELSRSDLRDLFSWPSNSTIQADNPNLLIAKATNSSGEVVGFVTAEPLLVINNYIMNPHNADNLQLAGNALDSALAQRAGATRIWFVVPDDFETTIKDEKFIRVVERKAYPPVTATQRLGSSNFQSSAGFLN